MTLLAFDDPVFVIDLVEELEELERPCSPGREGTGRLDGTGPPAAPQEPIAAVALLVARDLDPVLLEIAATRDAVMLDALARLVRMAVRTGATLQAVALGGDDPLIGRLWRARQLPGFVYAGPPKHVMPLLPPRVARIFSPAGA